MKIIEIEHSKYEIGNTVFVLKEESKNSDFNRHKYYQDLQMIEISKIKTNIHLEEKLNIKTKKIEQSINYSYAYSDKDQGKFYDEECIYETKDDVIDFLLTTSKIKRENND